MKRLLITLFIAMMLIISACQTARRDPAELDVVLEQNQTLTQQAQEAEDKIRELENMVQTPTVGKAEQNEPSQPLTIDAWAEKALAFIQERDFQSLALMVHPELGLRFSPYGHVELDRDLVFNKEQVAAFGDDDTVYNWGIQAGSGHDIELTVDEYWGEYVLLSEPIGLWSDYEATTSKASNTIDNIAEAYPGLDYIEFYHPGKEEWAYFDWGSLRLVFSAHGEGLYLVGIVHDEWTP